MSSNHILSKFLYLNIIGAIKKNISMFYALSYNRNYYCYKWNANVWRKCSFTKNRLPGSHRLISASCNAGSNHLKRRVMWFVKFRKFYISPTTRRSTFRSKSLRRFALCPVIVCSRNGFIRWSSNPLRGNSRVLLRQLSEQRAIFGRGSFPQISRAWTMVTMPKGDCSPETNAPVANPKFRTCSICIDARRLLNSKSCTCFGKIGWLAYSIWTFLSILIILIEWKINNLLIGWLINYESCIISRTH